MTPIKTDYINLLSEKYILYRKTQKLYKSLKGTGLEVNVERSNSMLREVTACSCLVNKMYSSMTT
jgi:hypothetical protein